ncbi:MAG: DUF3187 family protein [Planctomycetes bacterium]|nr:DUF3187 family protein [Planctomycetota bacterium]
MSLKLFLGVLCVSAVSSAFGWSAETPLVEVVVSPSSEIFLAPLNTGGNNPLQSLVLIPPLESADTIQEPYVRSGVEMVKGNIPAKAGQTQGWLLNYDANLIEAFIDIRHLYSERVELRARVTGGVLAEDNSNIVLSKNSVNYLSGQRGIGIENLVLGAKLQLNQADTYTNALGFYIKLPLADSQDLIDSGGRDIAVSYIQTNKISDEMLVHFQLGNTFIGKEDVFNSPSRLTEKTALFYGIGVAFMYEDEMAFILQAQGNTNVFKKIKPIDANPLTIQGGIRYSDDDEFFTDVGLGIGLNDASADFMLSISVGTAF